MGPSGRARAAAGGIRGPLPGRRLRACSAELAPTGPGAGSTRRTGTSSRAAPATSGPCAANEDAVQPAATACRGCCADAARGTCAPRCSARTLSAPAAGRADRVPPARAPRRRARHRPGRRRRGHRRWSSAWRRPSRRGHRGRPAARPVVPAVPAARPGFTARRRPAGRAGRLPGAGGHRRLAGVRPPRTRPAQRLHRPAARPGLREHARRRRPRCGTSPWIAGRWLGPDLDRLRGHHGAADPPQGSAAPGRRAARRRARGRRGPRLQPRRPPARRRAGHRGRAAGGRDGRRRAGCRSCSTAACAAAPTSWPRSRSAPPRSRSAGPCSGGSPRTGRRACGRCWTCCAPSWTRRSHWPGRSRPADLTRRPRGRPCGPRW